MRLRRAWPLAAGLLLLSWLWLGPLAEMARRAFSPHMILHLGVVVVAAPLIVVGLLQVYPHGWLPQRPLLAAITASAFEFVVLWGWHAPAMHEAAARWDLVFMVQQASFLAAGVILWWICLASSDGRSLATGVLAMLFTSMHMSMLGVLLVLAPTLVYAPQFCLGAFGLDPLEDQQFGSGLMALFGALPFVVGGGWLASRLSSESVRLRCLPAPVSSNVIASDTRLRGSSEPLDCGPVHFNSRPGKG